MTNQLEIIKLKTGDTVEHFIMITKIEERTTKTNKPYVDLELRDKSTSISGKLWDNFSQFLLDAKVGDIVKVGGIIEDFRGAPQLKINKIRLATPQDPCSADDFVPKSERDISVMTRELENRIKQISNPFLKKLITTVLNEENLKKYIRVPAGKSWHHAYVHGLLEHTLEIIKICDLMCSFHKEINQDLLITGAVLHDFGKIQELSFDSGFDYTDKGKLIGHIVIAAMEVEKAAASIKNFPVELKDQLIHIVLSHQGKLEHASPVEPKTLEAIVLYHADELSAKTNAYKNAIKLEESSEGNWTKFLPLANTSLYKATNSFTDEENKTLFDN